MKNVFKERKENLIKRFEIKQSDEIAYIVSTFIHILNRWKQGIVIYVFNKNGEKNDKTKDN